MYYKSVTIHMKQESRREIPVGAGIAVVDIML